MHTILVPEALDAGHRHRLESKGQPALERIPLTAVDLSIQPFEPHSTDGTGESRECEESNPLWCGKKGKDRVRVTDDLCQLYCLFPSSNGTHVWLCEKVYSIQAPCMSSVMVLYIFARGEQCGCGRNSWPCTSPSGTNDPANSRECVHFYKRELTISKGEEGAKSQCTLELDGPWRAKEQEIQRQHYRWHYIPTSAISTQ